MAGRTRSSCCLCSIPQPPPWPVLILVACCSSLIVLVVWPVVWQVPPTLAQMAAENSLLGGPRQVDASTHAGGLLAAAPGSGLHERVVAAESVAALGAALRAARPPLVSALMVCGGPLVRDAEQYFGRTVEAAEDLRECLLQVRAVLCPGRRGACV